MFCGFSEANCFNTTSDISFTCRAHAMYPPIVVCRYICISQWPLLRRLSGLFISCCSCFASVSVSVSVRLHVVSSAFSHFISFGPITCMRQQSTCVSARYICCRSVSIEIESAVLRARSPIEMHCHQGYSSSNAWSKWLLLNSEISLFLANRLYN